MSESEAKERPPIDPTTMVLHEKVRHAKLSDFATWEEEPDPKIMEAVEGYFSVFCAPIRETSGEGEETTTKEYCPGCGQHFGGLMANFGFGVGIEWGLVHGEGRCSGCGYPYRAHHRIWDPNDLDEERRPKEGREPLMTISNMFLAYHPDGVVGWKLPEIDRRG